MTIPEWFHAEHEHRKLYPTHELKKTALQNIATLRQMIEDVANCNENHVQQFLKENPVTLSGFISRLGHDAYALPEQKIGNYQADWLIAETDSSGIHWTLIELENPQQKPMKKDGEFRSETNHAMTQIKDWRGQIGKQYQYLSSSRSEGGVGLHGIRPNSPGLVVIGRREVYAGQLAPDSLTRYNELRFQSNENDRIRIVSYETFLDECEGLYRRQPLSGNPAAGLVIKVGDQTTKLGQPK